MTSDHSDTLKEADCTKGQFQMIFYNFKRILHSEIRGL